MKNVYELYKEVAKKQGLFGTGISVNKFKKTLCCFEEGHRKAVEEYIEKMKDLGDNNYFIPMPSLYLSMAYNLNYVKGNKITRGCVYFAKKENIGAEILIKYAVDWTRKNATNLIECEWSTTLVAYELEEYELLEEKRPVVICLIDKNGLVKGVYKNTSIFFDEISSHTLHKTLVYVTICSHCGSLMAIYEDKKPCRVCDKEKRDEIMKMLTYSADKRLPFMVAPKEVINKLMEKTGFSFPLLGIAQEMEKFSHLISQIVINAAKI